MTADDNAACRAWYEQSYAAGGFTAQRRYPNEELLRFLGRHYFGLPMAARRSLRVLEIGCGSGANLWSIAREGFDSYGIDLSLEGVRLCRRMLGEWQASARLCVADMTSLPFAEASFDVVADVFSAYCLPETGFARLLDEVRRVLRPGGRFFSYTPSKASDAFRDPGDVPHIDGSTVLGIRRADAAYAGNLYPFRFIAPEEYASALEARGMRVGYRETVGRTYRAGAEYFAFVVVVGERPQ
jgi:SAM-dependent methyltransferase